MNNGTTELVVPTTYYQWSRLLERMGEPNAEKTIFPLLQQGTLVWQAEVAPRFMQRILKAVAKNQEKSIEMFKRAVVDNSEGTWIHALTTLKQNIALSIKLIGLPCIPKDVRRDQLAILKQSLDKLQIALNAIGAQDKTGKLALLIKDHPVYDLDLLQQVQESEDTSQVYLINEEDIGENETEDEDETDEDETDEDEEDASQEKEEMDSDSAEDDNQTDEEEDTQSQQEEE